MRVHAIQLGYDDAEPVEARRERAAALVAQQSGADLVVLPELWAPTGFGYRDWPQRAEPIPGPTTGAIAAAARQVGAIVHAGSVIERGPGGQLWNTSILLGPTGELLATYRKIHRFGFGAGEPVLLQPGAEVVTARLPGQQFTAGLATCYDLRFPELFRRLVDAGATLLIIPAAWPAARVEHWRLLARARAVEDQCFVVACNTAGTHAGVPMGGHSHVVAPDGEVLAEAGLGEEVLIADVAPAAVDELRRRFPVLDDRRLG